MDIKTWRPKILCLSSGGSKGLYILGALFLARQRGYLENVDTYIGSSVGAILEGLMICGWTPHEIMEHACQMSLFKDFSDIEWTQITKEYGLFPNSSFNDNLGKKLDWMIRHKFGRIPTLLDLYEITGKRIIFVVVSLKEERALYLDYINSPDLDLLKVMRMSSNIPGIFGKLEYQKDLFIDGAFIDPFPIGYLDDKKTPILGIAVEDVRGWDLEKIGPATYFDRITGLPIKEMMNFAIAKASDQCVIINIPVKDDLSISILDNGKNVGIRIKMFQKGYKFAETFFDTFDSRRLRKCKKEISINSSVIKECLKSKSVEILLKSMEENPELLRELLKDQMSQKDYNSLFHFTNSAKEETQQKEPDIPTREGFFNDVPKSNPHTFKQPKEHVIPTEEIPSKELIIVDESNWTSARQLVPESDPKGKEEEDEEILEIPRSAFRPSFMENMPNMRMPFSPGMGNRGYNYPLNSVVIKIDVSREMVELFAQIGAQFLKDIIAPRLGNGGGNSLRKF